MIGGYHEGIEDQSLFSIIQGCKRLRKLSLDKRTQFTQKALAALGSEIFSYEFMVRLLFRRSATTRMAIIEQLQ